MIEKRKNICIEKIDRKIKKKRKRKIGNRKDREQKREK